MATVTTNIQFQTNDNAWFSANASLVLLDGESAYHVDGRYKFGDGVTVLSALSFLGAGGGGGSQDLQSVTDLGSVTTNNVEANSFVKTGGVSTEFLKGDGTVDTNTYLTTESQTLQNVTDLGNTTTNDIQFDAGVGVLLDNTSRLREGTIDAGYGGAKGIAQICAVGYELKWESGSLYVMNGDGTQIRYSLYNFASIPGASEDISKGFTVGSRWSLDNGDVYLCTDNTITAAVWVLQTIVVPTLAEVLAVGNSMDATGFIYSESGGSNIELIDSSIDLLTHGGDSEIYMDSLNMNLTTQQTLSLTATNVTKNGVEIATINDIPTKTSDLTNDGDDGISHFITLNDLPSNLSLYATNVASDISGYSKLVSSITDPSYNTTAVNIPTGAITTTNQFISSLATSANIIVGNPGIFNITTIGNIRRTSGTGNAEFYFEVWKRVAAGTETLITTSGNTLPVFNGTYAEFSASALWNDGTFLTTDRIVLKFYGTRVVGGSNPSYEFQFGGISPVRSLVPIPLNVTTSISQNITNGVTDKSPSEDVVYDALATKLNIAATTTTGVALTFITDSVYGSIATPETGNITYSATGANIGVTNIIIHNNSVAPTFATNMKKLSGSGTYTISVVNYIYVTYINSTEVIYAISQRT